MILPEPYEDNNTKSLEEAAKLTIEDVKLFLRKDVNEYEKQLEESAKPSKKKCKQRNQVDPKILEELKKAVQRREEISRLFHFKDTCMHFFHSYI